MIIQLIALIFSLLSFVLILVLVGKSKKNKELELILKQNTDTRLELSNMLENQKNSLVSQLVDFDNRLNRSLVSMEQKNVQLSDRVDTQLEKIREDNLKRLENIRTSVDEKLSTTLSSRLGESFKLVSEQLDRVHSSLGEMKNLSIGVNDLTRLLGNIKTRGTWGEIQAENILEQILTPDQWEKNVATVKNSTNRVEFAIKLPGKNDGNCVYLPIDAKFPKEDYERLLDAVETADKEKAEIAKKALSVRIEDEAKSISTKYINPPNTTDFAILFLPIEGLYAQVLSLPGIFDKLQNKYKVIISGPTTLSALINSLYLGFRTLAIEKRSDEVWQILSSVKNEFAKFSDQLSRTQMKLSQASSSIEHLETRTRIMSNKLKKVEQSPILDEKEDQIN